MGKGFLCLKIENKVFQALRCLRFQCQDLPQPERVALASGCQGRQTGGLPGGGAGCSGPQSPPPLTPAVLLLQPENTLGLSSR